MLDFFTDWPLDGLIIFIFLCVGIALLITSTSFIKLSTVQPINKKFVLKAGKCATTCFVGILVSTVCVLYAISQSYQGQEIPAFGVGIFFTAASIYYYYAHFLQKISFDTKSIMIERPFCTPRNFNWGELDSVEPNSNLKITFHGNNKLTVSGHLDGMEQLYNLICTELSGLDSTSDDTADSSRSFAFFKNMEGKKILIGISHVTENLELGKLTQLHGTAQEVDENLLKITLEGQHLGEPFTLPADPYAFIELGEEDGFEITLSSTNEAIKNPDFIAEYYSMNKKWA